MVDHFIAWHNERYKRDGKSLEIKVWTRPKSAKSADLKKRPPKSAKNEDDEGGDEKELGVEEDSDSEDENGAKGDLDDDLMMPFTQSFIFSMLWALGGYLEDSERSKLEAFLRGQVTI